MPISKYNHMKKRLVIVLVLLTLLTALPLLSVQASVGLLYFRAVAGTNNITLEWETAQEIDNLGFNLYRGLSDDFDEAHKLNSSMIPSASGGATGAFYQWPDNNVQIGTQYTYWLEDVDLSGNPTLHDPVTTAATGGSTLPTVPSPGGGNSTATPTRTPTRTPSPTTQSGSTATPTQTPTRTPPAQPTSLNPTTTTVSQVPPTAVSNNISATSVSQSIAVATADPEKEEPTLVATDDPSQSLETAANFTGTQGQATPRALSLAPSEDGGQTDGLTVQPIGQGGTELQEAAVNSDNSDNPDRSTVVLMALIVSIILLFAGAGGIIVLLLNRTK
jgi:hypothetical protein